MIHFELAVRVTYVLKGVGATVFEITKQFSDAVAIRVPLENFGGRTAAPNPRRFGLKSRGTGHIPRLHPSAGVLLDAAYAPTGFLGLCAGS